MALLVVTDADASAISGIATHITTRNSGVLLLFSCRSHVLIFGSQSVCNVSTGSDSGMYSELLGPGQNFIGKMWRSIPITPRKNLSINNGLTSNGTARLCATLSGPVRVGHGAERTAFYGV